MCAGRCRASWRASPTSCSDNLFDLIMSINDVPLALRKKGVVAVENVPLAVRKQLALEDLPLAKRLVASPEEDDVPLAVRKRAIQEEVVVVDVPQRQGHPAHLQQIGVIGEPGGFRTLDDVRRAAAPLMEKHLPGWSFGFDKATSRAGVCRFGPRSISLSAAFVLSKRVPDSEILNTILHEIAHGLAGPHVHHGPAWKKIAMDLGCTGDRCHSFSFTTARYKLSCPCGKVDMYVSKLRPRGYGCRKCKGVVRVTNTGVTRRGVRQ